MNSKHLVSVLQRKEVPLPADDIGET